MSERAALGIPAPLPLSLASQTKELMKSLLNKSSCLVKRSTLLNYLNNRIPVQRWMDAA